MDWTILGISPTKDKSAITAAYRAKVVAVNPEDKPEEFKALRAAYEEALARAAQKDAPAAEDTSPLGRWAGKLRALYDDFAGRIDPESWRELLRDDVCIGIDSRPQAEEKLLQFLMEDYFLPQTVWQTLDEAFGWSGRVQELYEHYPRDFIDFAVMNGIRLSDTLPYGMFTPGRDGRACDDYRRIYYRATGQNGEELLQSLEQLEALGESHPYGRSLRCRAMAEQGQTEEGRRGMQALAEAYPQDPVLVMNYANERINSGDWETAERLARSVTELDAPLYRAQAKRALAHCLAQLGRLEDAKDVYFDLMHAAGGDQKEIYHLSQAVTAINEKLIAQLEAEHAAKPEDGETALRLGWCYLQNDHFDKAEAVRAALSPAAHAAYDYHLFSSKVFYARQEWASSLRELEALEAILRALPADCEGDDRKHLNRLPEFLQIQGSCLMLLERADEALPKFEEAIALSPNDGEVITRTGHLYFSRGEYDKALAMAQRLTEVMPQSYHSHFLLAQVLFEMRRDQEAYNAINRALDLDRTDLGVYILKMRILLRNGVYEEVASTLDFLAANNITDELAVLWCRAQMTEFHEKNAGEALEQYRAIAARLENGEQLAWGSQVYLRITVLVAEDKDARKAEDRAELLALLDKGLAIDKNDFDCLDYKAWLLKRNDKLEEAKAIYHKLEQQPHSLNVERELADIYRQDFAHSADKALHYYEFLLQYEENDVNLFYAGTACRFLRLWDKGAKYFLRLQELEPTDIDGPGGLSKLYEWAGRYEEALTETDKAIAILEDRGEGNFRAYYLRRARQLRRLGRWEEAAETIRDLKERHGCDDYDRQLYDIYCQFGQFDRAAGQLKEWKRVGRQKSERIQCELRLKLLTGDLRGAKTQFFLSRNKMSHADQETIRELIAALEGDSATCLDVWSKKVKLNEQDTHALMNLAEQYAWKNDMSSARLYAARALPLLDGLIADHPDWEPLYRGRRAMVLVILGREAEARAELDKVRAAPLCDTCDYGACKDADAFEGFIEEVLGHNDLAARLYREGMERWPDEPDFAAGLHRMKRKDK